MAPVELPGADALVNVEVALSPGPREVNLVALALPVGATVAQALLASGMEAALLPSLHVGIWGRKTTTGTVLREGDRIECYRALLVDPKEARRVRYRAHGEKLPKGVHRAPGRAVNMTQSPGSPPGEAAD